MEENFYEDYKVYIKTDVNDCIIDINSSAFLDSVDGWIEIDSGTGDKYHHAQGNYFDNYLFDDSYLYPVANYAYENGVIRVRTTEEKKQDVEAMLSVSLDYTPSLAQLNADVTYMGMMLGVDI